MLRTDSLMPELVDRIVLIRKRIDSVMLRLTDSLSHSLNLQSIISDEILEINAAIISLKEKKQDDIFTILDMKGPAIWESKTDEIIEDSVKRLSSAVLFHYLSRDSLDYLKDQKNSLYKLGVYFLVLLWIFYWLKNKYQTIIVNEKNKAAYFSVFSRTVASVFIYQMLIIYIILPEMPYILSSIYNVVLFIPFLIVAFKITNNKLKWGVIYLFLLFVILKINSFYNTVYSNNNLKEELGILVCVAIIVYMFWVIKNRKFIISVYSNDGFWLKLAAKLSPMFLLLNIVALISIIIGYVGLGIVIAYGTLISFLIVHLLQVFLSNITGFIHLLFQTKFALGSRILKANTARIENFFKKMMLILSILFWVKYTLINLLVYDFIENWGKGLRDTGYDFGETTISIGGVIDFFTIIIVFWLLSNFIKLLLRDEILSRFNLSRGIPMAISTIVQYTIVIIGFAMAMSSVGFDMSNLGILAGALGVGIGFGLQSIVGNFISGLILIFERPIAVGDVIIADTVEGTVTKIGIRASTILLYNNSEVIVPNQDLISKQVTNLTLTNETRRKELSIYTNLNADPKIVMQLMEIATSEVKDVMKYPEPQAAYKGIVDQSHEFIIYFRLSDNIVKAQSDVALSVISKLKEAEIDMYIPKKVVVESKGKGII